MEGFWNLNTPANQRFFIVHHSCMCLATCFWSDHFDAHAFKVIMRYHIISYQDKLQPTDPTAIKEIGAIAIGCKYCMYYNVLARLAGCRGTISISMLSVCSHPDVQFSSQQTHKASNASSFCLCFLVLSAWVL
jgi:hypothetical protein